MVATPHVRAGDWLDPLGLPGLMAEVRAHVGALGIPLELHCGGELAHELVPTLGQHELQTIAHGPPGARWLLVEAPFEGIGEDFHLATDELRDRGFGVLLAHPERSADVLLERRSRTAARARGGLARPGQCDVALWARMGRTSVALPRS